MSNERSGNSDIERTLIKARFGNDVRKVSVRHNEDLTYDDLCIMMQRIFKIEPSTNIILKYRDEDNDLVTIADDNDLLLALNTQRNLSIVALADCGDVTNIEKLVSELELIRSTASAALESLKLIRTCGVEPPVFGVGGNERPDTPAHKETVATIQPSVHEQVSNSTGGGVTHPPAPSIHFEKPVVELSGNQPNSMIKEFEHPTLTSHPDGAVPPRSDEPSIEPTTEIDISDKSQSAFTPISKQELNEMDVHKIPGVTNAASAPPVQQTQMPTVPVPTAPFSSVPQQSIQPPISQSIPSVPTQNNSFTPPPTQFGYQPPQLQGQFSSPSPPFQQIAPQFQSVVAPVPRLMSALPTSLSSMTPPVSMPTASLPGMPSSQPPIPSGVGVGGIQTSVTASVPSTQPVSTPALYNSVPQPLNSMQAMYGNTSQSSTPNPGSYVPFMKQDTSALPHFADGHPPIQLPSGGVSTPASMPPSSVPPSSVAPNSSLPPASFPPSSVPPMSVPCSSAQPTIGPPPTMPFAGAAVGGANPFNRDRQTPHYPRPSFMPSSFQQ